jgi:TM2 domain-containing membrane protein YozV
MKDKNVAAVLALFLGGLGVHKFYLGRIGAGIVYLVFFWTAIPAMLGLIDFFVLALMENDAFNRRYNGMMAMPPVVVNMLPPLGQHPQGYPPPPMAPHGYPEYGMPSPQSATAVGPPLSPDELATSLQKLNELRIAGLLTEEEFTAQKRRLLGQM